MSVGIIIPQFSSLGMPGKGDERHEAGVPSPSSSRVSNAFRHDTSARINDHSEIAPSRRKLCSRCNKALPLCICGHVETVVENKTAITILQHPLEKKHPLGTARIALLGLRNVEVIAVPEIEPPDFCRIRDKVPGSKRFLAGRGGKESLKPEAHDSIKAHRTGSRNHTSDPELQSSKRKPRSELDKNSCRGLGMTEEDKPCAAGASEEQDEGIKGVPPWIKLQPNAGLLFPSQRAVDLCPVGAHLGKTSSEEAQTLQFETGKGGGRWKSNFPSQLIIIDGTWSKARRIYYENPWLSSLPHYQLPTVRDSRYGGLRREPKPGFVSTIESIVCALKLLEPETQGLESLLDVFENMVEHQLKYMEIQQSVRNINLQSARPPSEISPGVEGDCIVRSRT